MSASLAVPTLLYRSTPSDTKGKTDMTGSTITITGNLTRDPELRFTPSGQATTSFGIAVNRRWLNRGERTWEESTSSFDVVAWAILAENATQSLARGTRVTVTGRLEQRSWETPEGQRRSKVEIIASDIATSPAWVTANVTKSDRQAREASPVNEDRPAF